MSGYRNGRRVIFHQHVNQLFFQPMFVDLFVDQAEQVNIKTTHCHQFSILGIISFSKQNDIFVEILDVSNVSFHRVILVLDLDELSEFHQYYLA